MKPGKDQIRSQVQAALDEDIGAGDVTAALIPVEETATARLISRQGAIVCGCDWFESAFQLLDDAIVINWMVRDGDTVDAEQTLCEIRGAAASILSAERTALNFLQTLSATATETAVYVNAIEGTGASVLDTRKTLPGFRLAQKYAVLCGGGRNHRVGLYDMILIKENHIRAAGSITRAMEAAKARAKDLPVEIEVESLSELSEALNAGATRVLLDNFSLGDLVQAVDMNEGRAKLEASGGVTLQTIRDIAETGVDYISVGSLTKDVKAVDFSLLFDVEPVK